MKIKEFEALTLKDCLNQVRRDLGPDAVILETRKLRAGGIFGIGAHDAVRIVAGTGIEVTESPSRPRRERSAPKTEQREEPAGSTDRRTVRESAVGADLPAVIPATARNQKTAASGSAQARRQSQASLSEDTMNPRVAEMNISGATPTRSDAANAEAFFSRHAEALARIRGEQSVAHGEPSEPDPVTREKISSLEREMRELKDGIASLRHTHAVIAASSLGVPGPPAGSGAPTNEQYRQLIDSDLPEEMALELASSVPNFDHLALSDRIAAANRFLRDQMEGRIAVSGPIELSESGPKIVALVGPTGVGKTTTIAKLAALYSLVEKKRVGLVTMDTYRIAAVEQLRIFGQIIDIPVEVAYSQSDIAPAVSSLACCDLILIDTAGRSQRNAMQVSELKTLVDFSGCETHLVLAASTRERDLLDQVERFSSVGIDRLIFTKLDETTTYGTLYAVAAKSGIPVSYVAAGQKVPEDIETATASAIVDLLLSDVSSESVCSLK